MGRVSLSVVVDLKKVNELKNSFLGFVGVWGIWGFSVLGFGEGGMDFWGNCVFFVLFFSALSALPALN